MKSFTLILGLVLSTMSSAEVWIKPPYSPDEGHLQEEIEKQEEASKPQMNEKKIKKPGHETEKEIYLLRKGLIPKR